jgi:uncharacterized membrane protein YidH (DUF202 family)
MNRQPEIRPRAAFSDYLAAERTLLAWIRMGLALMGFRFVMAIIGGPKGATLRLQHFTLW